MPKRALQSLQRISYHRVSINGASPLYRVSSKMIEQREVLTALNVKQLNRSTQLSVLQGRALN